MAIKRVAPIKGKKTVAINSTGSLFISTSRTNDDIRNPRVYIASSSPSVPLTELKFNELTDNEREEYGILFNQVADPVNFMLAFQDVVTNNLLQAANREKEEVLEEISDFIADTAEILVVALDQQEALFTADEIDDRAPQVETIIETITQAQQAQQTTELGDGVVTTPSTSATAKELTKIIKEKAETQTLVDKGVDPAEAERISSILEAQENLTESGYRQVAPDLWIGPRGEEVFLEPTPR